VEQKRDTSSCHRLSLVGRDEASPSGVN